MGKEQDLLQAVKSGDLLSTQKLLSKLKTNRNSKYAGADYSKQTLRKQIKCLSCSCKWGEVKLI